VRRTDLLIRVAVALMTEPRGRHYGLGLARETGDLPGSVYPLLRRMLDEGWLVDGWESDVPSDRPPRRYYELTAVGQEQLVRLLRTVQDDPRYQAWVTDRVRATLGAEVRRVRDR
jgi:PadR family transcriptional regulator PadR